MKLDLILENVKNKYSLGLLEEGENLSEKEVLKGKILINESIASIRKMLIQENILASAKLALQENWEYALYQESMYQPTETQFADQAHDAKVNANNGTNVLGGNAVKDINGKVITEAQHAGEKLYGAGVSLDRRDIGNEETREARKLTANLIRWQRQARDKERKEGNDDRANKFDNFARHESYEASGNISPEVRLHGSKYLSTAPARSIAAYKG